MRCADIFKLRQRYAEMKAAAKRIRNILKKLYICLPLQNFEVQKYTFAETNVSRLYVFNFISARGT